MSLSMLGSLVTAVCLAQAERAPDAPPLPPPSSLPAPPPAPPPPGPTSEPPSEPTSEPPSEPTSLLPPPVSEPPLDYALGIGFGGARRLGETAGSLGPRHGFEISTQLGQVWGRPGGLELSAGAGFSYQRFRSTVPIKVLEVVSMIEDDRTFSFYEFQLHQTVSLPLGEGGIGTVRPYLDAGAGFTLAYFSTREPELAPGEKRTTRPIASATLGLDVVTTHKGARLGLAAGVVHVFRAPPLVAPGDRRVDVFGTRAMLRLSFLQPF